MAFLFDLLGMAAGGSLKAGSFFMQADQADQAADFNWRVAKRNASAIDDAIEYENKRVRFDIGELRRQVETLKGTQVATMAAANIAIEEGTSAEDILVDTAKQAAIDEELILAESAERRYSLRVERSEILDQGRIDRWFGRRTRDAAYMKSGASILSTGARMRARYADAKRTGVI